MHKKAFTLIEVLIVTLILGLLAALLLNAYVTMTKIAFRVQQEKSMTEQIVYVMQVMQNIAEKNTIDYERYEQEFGPTYLIDNDGQTSVLFLTWWQWPIAISLPDDCAVPQFTGDQVCILSLESTDNTMQLSTNTTPFAGLLFHVMPYTNPDKIIGDSSLCEANAVGCIRRPGFWFTAHVYTPYQTQSLGDPLSIPIQMFYHLPQ